MFQSRKIEKWMAGSEPGHDKNVCGAANQSSAALTIGDDQCAALAVEVFTGVTLATGLGAGLLSDLLSSGFRLPLT